MPRISIKTDILLLLLFPIISVILSLSFKANFLTSILLFLGLPSLWLSLRTQHKVWKTFVFSLVLCIPLSLVIDYIAILDGAWHVPNSVFPYRIFDVIPIEDVFFGFFVTYSVVIYYEHFFERNVRERYGKRFTKLIGLLSLVLCLFVLLLVLKAELLRFPYAYLAFGTSLILIPSIIYLTRYPNLLSKYIKTAGYFFALFFLFEITGLQLGQWEFPGVNFIGYVELMGYRFPFEEFFFWFCMTAIGVLTYYEFFDDDGK